MDNVIKNVDLTINIKISDADYIILDKINSNKLTDFFEVSQGLIPYDKYRGHTVDQIKNRVYHSTQKEDKTYKKELKGSDIDRYFLQWNGQLWISYGNWLAAPRKADYFKNPRILIMEVTRGTKYALKSCFIEEEFYNTPSIINIISSSNDIEKLKYLLSTINSSLFSWYHKKVNPKANAQTSIPKILVKDVRNLPFKKISQKAQEPFVKKVNQILAAKKHNPKADTSKLEAEIDQLVYKLYGLTEEEIGIVEG